MNVVQLLVSKLLVMTECLLLEVARQTRNRRTGHRRAVTVLNPVKRGFD